MSKLLLGKGKGFSCIERLNKHPQIKFNQDLFVSFYSHYSYFGLSYYSLGRIGKTQGTEVYEYFSPHQQCYDWRFAIWNSWHFSPGLINKELLSKRLKREIKYG